MESAVPSGRRSQPSGGRHPSSAAHSYPRRPVRRPRHHATRVRVLAAAAVTLLLAAVLAGCGIGGGASRPSDDATLVLDFTPNAVHVGIYSAVARDYTGAEGVNLTVRQPSQSSDSIKLLESERADFAILDIHDLGIAREQGAEVVGVMALVQRPLASVLAQPGIRSPRDLEGERVGVTGLPSDRAVLRSIVRGAGGDPARVRETQIGFNAVPALIGGRVAGATAFWNVEGVALARRRPRTRVFRVDQFGAPSYPELILCTTPKTIEERPNTVRALLAALSRGYEYAQTDPESALSDLQAEVPGLDRELLTAELDAVGPAFTAGVSRFGELDPARLGAWSAWDVRFGILERPVDIRRAFDARFLPAD